MEVKWVEPRSREADQEATEGLEVSVSPPFPYHENATICTTHWNKQMRHLVARGNRTQKPRGSGSQHTCDAFTYTLRSFGLGGRC